jgi:ADP-heptose:LPS heptosyltransferase
VRAPLLLVYRALGLGDLLTAVPALRALADAFPHHHRVLAAPAWVGPLALHIGVVHGVLECEPLRRLPRAVGSPEVGVNLHGRGPQSHRVLLATHPGRLVSFACPDVEGTREFPEWRPEEHEVVRWCRLLEESGIPADPSELSIEAPDRPLLAGAGGATLIHPGAASAARRWPATHWAAVARHERAAGRDVVVSGSERERALAARVARDAGLSPDSVIAGRTDLLDLAAHVAAAGRVVCGDTGVAHLATALGRPSVILFGPTSPAHWGPPRDPRHHVLWAGRWGDPHGDEVDPGLEEIAVSDVVAALDGLPDRALSASGVAT